MTKRMKFVIVIVAAALLLPLAMLRPAAVADKASLLPVAAAPDNGIIVVVDAGHGGKDTGMVGIGGVREKDIDLAIALKLRDALTKKARQLL